MAIFRQSDKTKRVRKYPAGTVFVRHKWDDKVVKQGSKYRQLYTGNRLFERLGYHSPDIIPTLKLSLDSVTSGNYIVYNTYADTVDLEMPEFSGTALNIVASNYVRKVRLSFGEARQINRLIDGANIEEIEIEGAGNAMVIVNFASNYVRKLWRLRIDSLDKVNIASFFCRNACLDKPSILHLCDVISRRSITARITLDVGFCSKYSNDVEVIAAMRKASEKNVTFLINWNVPPEDVRAKAELEPVVTE